MKRICIFLLATLGFALSQPASAQDRTRKDKTGTAAQPAETDPYTHIYQAYADSLQNLRERFATWHNTKGDTLSNPYYFQLFSPPTFYPSAARESLGRLDTGAGPLGREDVEKGVRQALMHIYTERPWLIQNIAESPGEDSQTPDEMPREVSPEFKLSGKNATKAAPAETETDIVPEGLDIMVRRPNFWKFKSNFSFQFLQNHVSENWYKGGEKYNSMKATMNVEANYNNKQKVVFSNLLEMRLGFQTSHKDEEHKFKTNTDLLRLTNKLGLRATKHWYYTVMLQSWTQFYRGYKANDTRVYSDFMSPFESLFSIGMDYNLNLKKFTLSATISPFACNFKYVGRKDLETSFGLDEGRHTKFEFGSNLTVKYNWTIFQNVSWNGRIYYFTDYDKAQIEWENTFKLRINKALSTQLFLYPRFDDSAKRKEGKSYFQFLETLSVGLDLSF